MRESGPVTHLPLLLHHKSTLYTPVIQSFLSVLQQHKHQTAYKEPTNATRSALDPVCNTPYSVVCIHTLLNLVQYVSQIIISWWTHFFKHWRISSHTLYFFRRMTSQWSPVTQPSRSQASILLLYFRQSISSAIKLRCYLGKFVDSSWLCVYLQYNSWKWMIMDAVVINERIHTPSKWHSTIHNWNHDFSLVKNKE